VATATLILTTRPQRRNHLLPRSPAPLPASPCSPRTYVEIYLHSRPFFSQNKPNFCNDKTNATSCAAKVYETKPPSPDSKKQSQSNPIFSRTKPMQPSLPQTFMKPDHPWEIQKKQTQSNPISMPPAKYRVNRCPSVSGASSANLACSGVRRGHFIDRSKWN